MGSKNDARQRLRGKTVRCCRSTTATNYRTAARVLLGCTKLKIFRHFLNELAPNWGMTLRAPTCSWGALTIIAPSRRFLARVRGLLFRVSTKELEDKILGNRNWEIDLTAIREGKLKPSQRAGYAGNSVVKLRCKRKQDGKLNQNRKTGSPLALKKLSPSRRE